jgi:hypothetical protein
MEGSEYRCMCARTHARTHTRARARTHTHTQQSCKACSFFLHLKINVITCPLIVILYNTTMPNMCNKYVTIRYITEMTTMITAFWDVTLWFSAILIMETQVLSNSGAYLLHHTIPHPKRWLSSIMSNFQHAVSYLSPCLQFCTYYMRDITGIYEDKKSISNLLTDQSTHSTQQHTSWEHSQATPCILCDLTVHYHICNSLSLVPILTQIIPVHMLSSYFLKMPHNIILQSLPRCSKWCLSLSFSTKTVHAPCPP